MNLTLPPQVLHELKIATGNETGQGTVRRNAYDVVQTHPESRINRWVSLLPAAVVNKADKSDECIKFYSTFPTYYKPLANMSITAKNPS